jgi:hypothetical protein
MMEKIKSWFIDRFQDKKPEPRDLRKASYLKVARPRRQEEPVDPESDVVKIDPELHGSIESIGPGKNVLIRNRLHREETGTHETLKIVDDSMIETGEETGIDPYNTGGFDRSKKWDQRSRE